MSQEFFLKVSPESNFIKDLEKHTKFKNELYDKFKIIREEFKIHTDGVFLFKRLTIVKNTDDMKKFNDCLLADRNQYLTFKKNSKVQQRWSELTKDIVFVNKPCFSMYFKQMLFFGRALSFWLNDHLYIRLETDQELEQVDWMQSITPMEFYQAKEQAEKAGE